MDNKEKNSNTAKRFKFLFKEVSVKQILIILACFLACFSGYLFFSSYGSWNLIPASLVNPIPRVETHFYHIKTSILQCVYYICDVYKSEIAQHFDLSLTGADGRSLDSRSRHTTNITVGGITLISDKYDSLNAYCQSHGLNIEDMFLHFKYDTKMVLNIHKTDIEVERTVPGWDPANDINKNGKIDNGETTSSGSTATEISQSRIPAYYWPQEAQNGGDFNMNTYNPNWKQFLVEFFTAKVAGEDGVWIDSCRSYFYIQNGIGNVLEAEYSSADINVLNAQRKADMINILSAIKAAVGDKLLIGNGWYLDPTKESYVIDGRLLENWKDIGSTVVNYFMESEHHENFEDIKKVDQAGKIQVLQYNLYGDQYLSNYNDEAKAREKIFGLASYYLFHGQKTYFAIGAHLGYQYGWETWSDAYKAIEYDVGQPTSEYYFWDPETGSLLKNNSFETDSNSDGKPDNWTFKQPAYRDSSEKKDGSYSVRIELNATDTNSNLQSLTLKPNTTYTFSAWIKTENVPGGGGGSGFQFYYWDSQIAGQYITIEGTRNWTKYSKTFKTGNNTVEGSVVFKIKGGAGKAWIDNVVLAEGDFNKVLARNYQNALVLVKPRALITETLGDETRRTFQLDKYYKPLNLNGSLGSEINSVNLRNGEAAILIKTTQPSASPPTVDIKVNGQDSVAIPSNSSAILSWTTSNANNCSALGDWSGSKNTSGSESTGNLTSNKSYTLSCNGPGGSSPDTAYVNIQGQPPQDISAPFISAVYLTEVTANTVTIGWDTDKSSDSQVEYGQGTSYGNLSNLNSGLNASHRITLSGLTPGTTYHYRVISKDSAGKTTRSGDYSFFTLSAGATNPDTPQPQNADLSVTLKADPSTGINYLTAGNLTAEVSGTSQGSINYTFYCNRSDSGTNLTQPWQAKFDSLMPAQKTIVDVCSYPKPGTYYPKVIVERGKYQAEARAEIRVLSSDESQPLTVYLSASPNLGKNSLYNVNLTANVLGTAQGTLNYTFYCDRSDVNLNVTEPYQLKLDSQTDTLKKAEKICSYPFAGTYYSKVIVERGSYQAQAQAEIKVSGVKPVQQLTLTYPNQGETLKRGESYYVKWNYTSKTRLGYWLKISLYKNNKLVKTLSAKKYIGNQYQGSYKWTLPQDLTPGAGYQIRIGSLKNKAYYDMSEGGFKIE